MCFTLEKSQRTVVLQFCLMNLCHSRGIKMWIHFSDNTLLTTGIRRFVLAVLIVK